jgi:hypothetical protein
MVDTPSYLGAMVSPYAGLGFTVHGKVGAFFVQAQWGPSIYVRSEAQRLDEPDRSAATIGWLGTPWLVLGGQWGKERRPS